MIIGRCHFFRYSSKNSYPSVRIPLDKDASPAVLLRNTLQLRDDSPKYMITFAVTPNL